MTAPSEARQPFREAEHLLNMPRVMGRSHRLTQSEIYRAMAFPEKSVAARVGDYLKVKVFLWIWHYLKSRFGGKYKFAEYALESGDTGVYELASATETPASHDRVKVSLVADWGTGTRDAHDIARLVDSGNPHFTIHLGDVYYVGTKKEIRENMFDPVTWPIGTRGSFALNANHEMYARGKGYFELLLPQLGMRDHSDVPPAGQLASFFCLKNEHWLVIGLDTGYYSVGLPIVELIFKPSCKLHRKLVAWLREVVKLQEDRTRGVIFLSHHPYVSQFEDYYDAAARQLSVLFSRRVLWFWGHEHRLALYGRHATKRGILEAYGRCIGHGGMPIELIKDEPKMHTKHRVGLVFYDKRMRAEVGQERIPSGFNGFADLVFEGNTLTVEHRDIDNQVLVEEVWEVDHEGVLHGKSIHQRTTHPDLVLYSENLHDAIA